MNHSRGIGVCRENGYSFPELLVVVGLIAVISAIAVPMMKNSLGEFSLSGDARSLTNAVSLAKLRAASDFTQARVYVDLTANTFHVETWNKTTAAWTTEGGTNAMSTNDTFSFGVVGTAPPNSHGTNGQASACVTSAGAVIGNTACTLFYTRVTLLAPPGARTA